MWGGGGGGGGGGGVHGGPLWPTAYMGVSLIKEIHST